MCWCAPIVSTLSLEPGSSSSLPSNSPLLTRLLKMVLGLWDCQRPEIRVSNVPTMQAWRPEFRCAELKKKKAKLCLWSHPERVETEADRSLKLSWIRELQVEGELLSQRIKIRSTDGEWPKVALCLSHVYPHTHYNKCIHHTYSIACTPQNYKIQISGYLVCMLWKIR